MGLFQRRKQANQNQTISLFSSNNPLFNQFGENISKSDVVKICIDRIATHSAKLKPRYIKKFDDKTVTIKDSNLSFLLQTRPNDLMTPYQFIYKIVTLLLINDNAFVYPEFSKNGEIIAIYPIRPTTVEPVIDSAEGLFLKFGFNDSRDFLLPYENIIHIKRFYGKNDIFGGNGYQGDHKALLKTLEINDNLLMGIDNAIKSSMQIKGILKMNSMLSEKDKSKQLAIFNEALNESTKLKGSSIVPVDLKAEYIPIEVDPKLIDNDTLEFLQSKILNYYGVSAPIFNNQYSEDEFNSFFESTIEPISIQLSEAFSNGLLTNNELKNGEEIIFFSERLQYASWSTKVNAIEKLMGLGIMSLNESRAILGLEPVEGGNKRLQSLNYVDATIANLYQIGEEEESK